MKKIVSLSLIMLLSTILSITTLAAPSKEATIKKEYFGGTASYSYNAEKNTVTAKVNLKKGYSFQSWQVSDDYEIVSGNKNSLEITLERVDDRKISLEKIFEKVKPIFKKTGSEKEKRKEKNKSSTAPKTSDGNITVIITALLALSGAMISVREIKRKTR